MTQLSVIGQTLSQQALLDHGITDIAIHETALGATLYTTSGPNGGVAAYARMPRGCWNWSISRISGPRSRPT